VKRHADLVEAAAIVSGQFADLRVLIAGECFEPVYSDLRRRAARLGIADRVHLLGDRRDIPDLLQIMDVYVQSSGSEGMSNALLEAMAAGRPVVATAVGGTPEVVTDGETGLLVPAAEPARLADAIAALLADPARARRMGETARARVERDFSASRMLARHLEGCRALLQRRGRR
jgi:glycosyltransferase involved in cell wall biosynthesis